MAKPKRWAMAFRKEYGMMKKMMMVCLILCLALTTSGVLAEAIDAGIREGAYGVGVKRLQEELTKLGYYQGEADGSYGYGTASAVHDYCKDRGIAYTGTIDNAILNALRVDLAEGSLSEGSTGTSVYVIQKILYNMGFMTSEPDGIFGAQTRQAAKKYMEYASESAVDFMQERVDARAIEAAATVEPGAQPIVCDIPLVSSRTVVTDGTVTQDWFDYMTGENPFSDREITTGSPREDVRRVQTRLKLLKYTTGGVDGAYGNNTAIALKYFQRRNGLNETGVCDVETQKKLFSDEAVESDQYVAPYMARVSTSENRVRIYAWTGAGYTDEVKCFKCSTGASGTPTIKGTIQAVGPISEWYYMENSHVWVRYAFQIQGNYFFHSVLYSSRGAKNPTSSSVNALGRSVSHGCVRLAVEDIKWMYENCTAGMTVVIT